MEFPESGAYLKNIMIFCGYKTPETITKLNDPKELNKMFKTVVELQELVPDHEKDEMFGIFRRNPSLLKILPGIEMEFKNLLPKIATTSNNFQQETTCQQSNFNRRKNGETSTFGGRSYRKDAPLVSKRASNSIC